MNERIQKLAEQTNLQLIIDDGDFDLRKFADKLGELIVKECANRATWAQDTNARDIGGEVLKHFGVNT
jgi:hypothetical protein